MTLIKKQIFTTAYSYTERHYSSATDLRNLLTVLHAHFLLKLPITVEISGEFSIMSWLTFT